MRPEERAREGTAGRWAGWRTGETGVVITGIPILRGARTEIEPRTRCQYTNKRKSKCHDSALPSTEFDTGSKHVGCGSGGEHGADWPLGEEAEMFVPLHAGLFTRAQNSNSSGGSRGIQDTETDQSRREQPGSCLEYRERYQAADRHPSYSSCTE